MQLKLNKTTLFKRNGDIAFEVNLLDRNNRLI